MRADYEDVAAAIWDFDSTSNIEISGDVEREVEAEGDGMNGQGFFEATVRRRQKLDRGRREPADRVFKSTMQMHRVDVDTIVLLTSPIAGAEVTTRRGSFFNKLRAKVQGTSDTLVQGSEKVAVRLRRIKQGLTKLDFAVELDMGSAVSKDAGLAFMKRRLDEAGRVSIYFQRLVPLEGLTKGDGKALADDLLFGSSSSKQRLERLPEVMAKNAALVELKTKYEGFEPMVRRFLSGSLGLSCGVDTKLVCISEKEGKQLGKNGVMAVKSKKLAVAGVDQWKRQVS